MPIGVGDTRITGKERDAETGLDYFGARYLSSAQGRFTSPDPVNHPAASKNPSAFLMNPQRWNGYSYVGNNPLRMVDPDGREEEESWLTMAKNYLAALFQPVSSVDAMTNPRVSGEQTAPWPTDPHEIAVAATKEGGQRAELAFNALSVFDVTGAGQLGKSMMEGSPGGVVLAAMGVVMPGGRSGGNIALSLRPSSLLEDGRGERLKKWVPASLTTLKNMREKLEHPQFGSTCGKPKVSQRI
ncbi:MAG: RHS repeat-associated core domain-containing protein [Acidobacteriota bacterium]|jgi:RHS repeat-associated protein